MPQSPLNLIAKAVGGALSLLNLDAQSALTVSSGGIASKLNVTGAGVVVKATPGRLVRISVVTAGSTAGTVNDIAIAGSAAAANQIGTLPNTVGTYVFEWPCAVGIVVVPGTAQVLAVSYL